MKEIKLSQGKVALVDDEDYERLIPYGWYYNERYAKATINYKKIYLHKFLIDCPKGMQIDHKDGNTLNNQKSNLRIATPAQNTRNRPGDKNSTSRFKGVSLRIQKDKRNGKVYLYTRWAAYIQVDKKLKRIGAFKKEEDAAIAYNEAAKKYYGEFAKLNVI